jgi:hypothetical protein
VLRRLANLGAAYPDVVTVLETANRQKNLPGQLVVDAVPTANNAYLEAVLGKDINGKRDDAVKRTSGESSRSPRLRFFGLFGGDEPAAPSAKNRSTASRGSTPSSDASMDMPPLPGDPSSPAATDNVAQAKSGNVAKKGDSTMSAPSGKKDDAVDRATDDGDDTPSPRRRLSDFFRKGDDS